MDLGKYKQSFIKGKDINVPHLRVYDFVLKYSLRNNKPLIYCHNRSLTRGELIEQSENYMKGLWTIGIRKGDIVPICLSPSIEATLLFFALNRLGAVTVFMNETSRVDDIVELCKSYKVKCLVLNSLFDEISRKMLTDNKIIIISVEQIISFDNEYKMNNRKSENQFDFLDNIISDIADINVSEIEYKDDSLPTLISFTSGTTGHPKSILLNNSNIVAELIMEMKTTHIVYGPKGNIMQMVPFNYPYGFIISVLLPLCSKRPVVLTPLINLENLKKYVDFYKPYMIMGIPPLYLYMCEAKEFENYDLSFLKYAISGGDKLSKKEKEKIINYFSKHNCKSKIYDGMGNGEGCGALTNTAVLFKKYNMYSVGMPNYGVSIKFVDENNRIVPVGEKGRFCFAGKNVMEEYYLDPEETTKSICIDENGRWFYTDTIGHMDKDGWLYFDGRERRFFITYDEHGSPYKVYCDYVQDVIEESGLVDGCAVVSIIHSKRYRVPVAYIVLKNKDLFDLNISKIKEYCNQALQRCEIPVDYRFITSIPLTTAGKRDYEKLEKYNTEE